MKKQKSKKGRGKRGDIGTISSCHSPGLADGYKWEGDWREKREFHSISFKGPQLFLLLQIPFFSLYQGRNREADMENGQADTGRVGQTGRLRWAVDTLPCVN